MPRYRSHSFGVTLLLPNPLIQTTDMPMGPSLPMSAYTIGRLNKGALQIAVHVRTHNSIADLAAAGYAQLESVFQLA